MDKFHLRLKEEREKRKVMNSKWTQGHIAEKIGVARVTYTAYENGTKQPPLDTINKIADVLEVTTDYLLGRTDNKNSVPVNEDKAFFMSRIATEFPDIDLMFKDMESLTAEQMEEVYDYIKYKVSKNK